MVAEPEPLKSSRHEREEDTTDAVLLLNYRATKTHFFNQKGFLNFFQVPVGTKPFASSWRSLRERENFLIM